MPTPPPPLFSNAMMRIFHTCSFPRDSQFAPVAYCASRSLPPGPVGLKFLNAKGWGLFASSLKRGIRFV
ncbi:unnamed protein product [Cuscuta campestris]|uniref:Uncharacterized protein n=1 Tax=Cuscuta campestris TaxID=132261 RepID=A0A484M6L5_9ASTE|nr:unnamed protein product [Cuscuta campestris]